MATQTTLLTVHKGVDLHAATAVRVMRDRLDGGGALVALHRCECHTFWNAAPGPTVAELLEVGRYFNPNKHHYGHFELADAALWHDGRAGAPLPAAWPGVVVGSDVPKPTSALYDQLLGGPVPAGCRAFDLCAWPLGPERPLLSGVLWRLVIRADGAADASCGQTDHAERLAVTRSGKVGLLVNPHMESWLLAAR
jgi:hypothetical protein